MNILLLVALGLAAGVRATPQAVPRTQALTRNVRVDKLEIRDCALVRRADDDDLSSQIGPQPLFAVVNPKRAQQIRKNQLAQARRVAEDPATAQARRAKRRAYRRAYHERLAIENPAKLKDSREGRVARRMALAIENPEKFKRQKEAATARKKAKLMNLAIENPEGLKSQKEMIEARRKDRNMSLAIENPEEFKRRKEAKSLYDHTRQAAKLARAQSSKMVADQEAQTFVGQKYRDKEAAEQQALTPPFFTNPASPSTQEAPSPTVQDFEAARLRPIHRQNKHYRTKHEAAHPLVTDPAGSSRRQATSSAVRPHPVLHPNAEHPGSFGPRQHEANLEAVQPTQQEHPEPEVDVLQWLVDTTPPTSPHAV